ncbi:uncharacterized protein LOC132174659 [Corylus avellana]|uniref:uncharacterized protein LOC132174659 n=1 Tax=Corylus avellana TaxID=13451 RepID=UPI00286C2564|nr:uncharacterized protein LOC132174659 [Corylus avellana]
MVRGMLFPAGLTVLIVVLVLAHEVCSAKDSHHHSCPPSSCGNIQNISYPFRLEGDPPMCRDQRYNLSCENNQTVLYLYAGKYYVREIDYGMYTIRVVDADMKKDKTSFIPRYFLNRYNFSSGDPYSLRYPHNIYVLCDSGQYRPIGYLLGWYDVGMRETGLVWVKCEKPMISYHYLDTSTCLSNGGVNSSNSSLFHSKSYRYVLYSDYISLDDLGDSCQIEQMFPKASHSGSPIRCSDVYDRVADGFKLSWVQVLCQNFRGDDSCYLNHANFPAQCPYPSSKLSEILGKAIEVVTKTLLPQIIEDIFFEQSGENGPDYDLTLGKLGIIMITYGEDTEIKARTFPFGSLSTGAASMVVIGKSKQIHSRY